MIVGVMRMAASVKLPAAVKAWSGNSSGSKITGGIRFRGNSAGSLRRKDLYAYTDWNGSLNSLPEKRLPECS